MKLLYGTGNLAKLSAMRNRLEQLDIELIGLNDLKVEGKNVPEVKEDGNTPLENARLKAMVYYEAFQIPYFLVIQDCILIMSQMRSSLAYMFVM